jgi:hypothetical protein
VQIDVHPGRRPRVERTEIVADVVPIDAARWQWNELYSLSLYEISKSVVDGTSRVDRFLVEVLSAKFLDAIPVMMD